MLLRSVLVNVPLAILLTAVAVKLVQLGLAVTDALSAAVSRGAGLDTGHFMATVTAPCRAAAAGSAGAPDLRPVPRRARRGLRRGDGLDRAAAAGRRRLRGRALPPPGPGQPGLAGHRPLVPATGRHPGRPGPLQVRDRGRPQPGRRGPGRWDWVDPGRCRSAGSVRAGSPPCSAARPCSSWPPSPRGPSSACSRSSRRGGRPPRGAQPPGPTRWPPRRRADWPRWRMRAARGRRRPSALVGGTAWPRSVRRRRSGGRSGPGRVPHRRRIGVPRDTPSLGRATSTDGPTPGRPRPRPPGSGRPTAGTLASRIGAATHGPPPCAPATTSRPATDPADAGRPTSGPPGAPRPDLTGGAGDLVRLPLATGSPGSGWSGRDRSDRLVAHRPGPTRRPRRLTPMARASRPPSTIGSRYRFPPLERRGADRRVAGRPDRRGGGWAWSWRCCRAVPPVGRRGSSLALAASGVGVALAFWPIRGRTGEQWLPLVVRWVWAAPAGDRRQLAPGPRRGPPRRGRHRVPVRVRRCRRRRRLGRGAPPAVAGRCFDGLTLTGVAARSAGRARRWAWSSTRGPARPPPCWRCGATASPCSAPADQDARVAAWARVLCLAGPGGVGRPPGPVGRDLPARRRRRGAAPLRRPRPCSATDSPAGRSYRALLDEASPVDPAPPGPGGPVRPPRHGRPGRSGRRAAGPPAPARVLAREVRLARTGALEAPTSRSTGCSDRGPGPAHRASLAPAGPPGGPVPAGPGVEPAPPDAGVDGRPRPTGRGRWPSSPGGTRCAPTAPGTPPTGSPSGRGSTSTPDFLGPLFFSPLRRSIAVVMEPVEPEPGRPAGGPGPHRRPGRRRAAPPGRLPRSRPGTPGRSRASRSATSSWPTGTPSTGSRGTWR